MRSGVNVDDERCERDGHGFCRFASAGNWKCFAGSDSRPCVETSAEEARERVHRKAVRAARRRRPTPSPAA